MVLQIGVLHGFIIYTMGVPLHHNIGFGLKLQKLSPHISLIAHILYMVSSWIISYGDTIRRGEGDDYD